MTNRGWKYKIYNIQGNGITVCNDLQEINKLISSEEFHPNGKPKTYIVQLYIDNPFLYNKRKFDIRCYILITSQNGI
jgi:tubulin polyglutamylase TTLL1